ncbi:MAG: polyphosphate kinase 2 family protein [Nitrospirales bacterium]|nr:polyphosphate kinase 2 family protein [Nitrospira sp.]MDR4500091.1 polyphosphate kinase 2 family protein [Nitrospirales bacterium]
MFTPVKSPYLVPFNSQFSLKKARTVPKGKVLSKKLYEKKLAKLIRKMSDRQRTLYAHDHHAVLLVFQAMDAAGKDSTIRAVTSGINPAGCQVFSFRQPSNLELDHDFLWRTTKCLPERGRIGIFNRSYYEEVLIVRVHPKYLKNQRLPDGYDLRTIWDERFESIRDYEQHLARNGTVIVKFWLNVSREEQKRRFLSRIQVPEKNWKFSSSDIKEREFWKDYMQAYEEALNATSRPWAPWYAIPADHKPSMRITVAEIVVKTLEGLGLQYPSLSKSERAELETMRQLLGQEN